MIATARKHEDHRQPRDNRHRARGSGAAEISINCPVPVPLPPTNPFWLKSDDQQMMVVQNSIVSGCPTFGWFGRNGNVWFVSGFQ